MRRAFLLFLLLLQVRLAGAQVDAEEDDPKRARAFPRPPLRLILDEEDDPKLGGLRLRPAREPHPAPRFKLAYRRLSSAGLDGGVIDFNAFELDYYPASGIVRFGLETALGLGGGPFGAWFFTTGASLGLQYPWRVTPFVEGRLAAGLVGGSYLGQTAVSYIYLGGIDGGIELYIAGRFYLSGAIGWAHPVFSGIDIDYVKTHPMLSPLRKEFANDTFTFKIGLGF